MLFSKLFFLKDVKTAWVFYAAFVVIGAYLAFIIFKKRGGGGPDPTETTQEPIDL